MKKPIYVSTFIFCFFFSVYSQETEISGTVTNEKGDPIALVNIAIKGCFDGTSSDENGNYRFTTTEKGRRVLSVSFIGYQRVEKEIYIENENIVLNFILHTVFSELETVNITAGIFEASDEKRTVVMRATDIGTTAGALGDITGAIATLPGTQTVGESTGLFVRGGSGAESKIIIDEMVVPDPYYSPVPDIKQRGRFDPFLFSGLVFSTGGYSALYGQALSSTLILKSKGLADSTNTGGGIYCYGGNLFHAQRWDKTSLYIYGTYNNMGPYHKTFKQLTDWEKSPENQGGKIIFRHRFSETGIFKFYSNFSHTHMAIDYDNVEDPGQKINYDLHNRNLLINASCNKYFKEEKWSVFIGSSYSHNTDDALVNNVNMLEEKEVAQAKTIITHRILSNASVEYGAEMQDLTISGKEVQVTGDINELYLAGFLETNWTITNNFSGRIGIRYEYSDLLKSSNLAPRTSFAYKTGNNSQISLAYGKFYQTPEKEFLYHIHELKFENSTHYIVNYQWIKNKRIIRIELFDKEYKDLIRNMTDDQINETNNSGTGFARGFDLFWRDKKSVPNAEYWISYSFLDTKRIYRNFPIAAAPAFASKHNLSVVYKHWISRINSMPGFSYTYASGRPYFNPGKPDSEFHRDQTKDYHNLDINISKMITLWEKSAVIYASVNNVLGQDHIFGYRYSSDGSERIPIRPSSIRSYFIGLFISTY